MISVVGIKIEFGNATRIFRSNEYKTPEEYDAAWISLTRGLAAKNQPFTADPIIEEVNPCELCANIDAACELCYKESQFIRILGVA